MRGGAFCQRACPCACTACGARVDHVHAGSFVTGGGGARGSSAACRSRLRIVSKSSRRTQEGGSSEAPRYNGPRHEVRDAVSVFNAAPRWRHSGMPRVVYSSAFEEAAGGHQAGGSAYGGGGAV